MGKCEKVETVAVEVRDSSRKQREQVGRTVGELVGRCGAEPNLSSHQSWQPCASTWCTRPTNTSQYQYLPVLLTSTSTCQQYVRLPRKFPCFLKNTICLKPPKSISYSTFSDNGSFFEGRIAINLQQSLTITGNFLDVTRGSRVPAKQLSHTFLENVRNA